MRRLKSVSNQQATSSLPGHVPDNYDTRINTTQALEFRGVENIQIQVAALLYIIESTTAINRIKLKQVKLG